MVIEIDSRDRMLMDETTRCELDGVHVIDEACNTSTDHATSVDKDTEANINIARVSTLRASTLRQRNERGNTAMTAAECRHRHAKDNAMKRIASSERKKMAELRRVQKQVDTVKRVRNSFEFAVDTASCVLHQLKGIERLRRLNRMHRPSKRTSEHSCEHPCEPMCETSACTGVAYFFDVMLCHESLHAVPVPTVSTLLSSHGLVPPRYIYIPPQFDTPKNKVVYDTTESELIPTLTSGFFHTPNPSARSMTRYRDAVKIDHPDVRPLYDTEAGVLSGFPVNYPWRGFGVRDIPRQIANAVPPPLGELAVRTLMACISGQDLNAVTHAKGPGVYAATDDLDGAGWIVVDLFCGAGGFTLGTKRAFRNPEDLVTIGFDAWDAAVTTHRLADAVNASNESCGGSFCFHGDVSDFNTVLRVVRKFQRLCPNRRLLVVGGPPCQDFSTVGRREHGVRANMLAVTALIARLSHADAVLVENVKALATKTTAPVFQAFCNIMTKHRRHDVRAAAALAGITDSELGRRVDFGHAFDVAPAFGRASTVGLPTKRVRVFFGCAPTSSPGIDGMYYSHDDVAS